MISISVKKIVHGVLLLLCVSFLPMPSTVQAGARQTLRVGYTSTPGYLTRDYQYRYNGVAYEYLEAIATYLGAKLEYIPGTEEENILRLQIGTIDMLPHPDTQTTPSLPPPAITPASGLEAIRLGPGVGFLLLATQHSQQNQLKMRIQSSIQEISHTDPFFLSQVREKYYSYNEQALTLTAEERNYLKQHKVIRAMSAPGEAPYTAFQDGEHIGIIADITAIIEQDLNIKIDVIPTDSQGQMLQHLADGDIDLVTDFYFDYNWGREHNAMLTLPYLPLNYVAVLRRDKAVPDAPIIACPRSHFYTHAFIEKTYPAEQLRYYDTVAECMAAVNDRQADMTFAKAITAQSDIYQGNYSNLYTSGNIVFTHKISMAISQQTDPILVRILNKEIAHLNQQDLTSIVNRQVYNVQSQDTLQALIYRNPISSILFIVATFTLIILCLLVVLMMRRRHAKELYRQANTVAGSDIYNTHWFASQLIETIQQAHTDWREGRLFLLVLSVQRLAALRERYGSQAFDEACKGGLKKVTRETPWILLYGLSAEISYAFLLCRTPKGKSIQQTAEQLLHIAGTITVNGTPTNFTYHMGICPVPRFDLLSSNILMDNAQLARNSILGTDQCIAIFNSAMQQKAMRQHQMELLMEKALKEEEFKVYLQPKYDLRSQSVCSAEALVRWDSPELGFLMPGQFIDLFERNGFAIQLDYYMLEHICRWQRERLEHGQLVVPISVNQSALHISEEGYLKNMRTIAEHYQLPTGIVELEITETAFVDFATQSERDNSCHITQSLKQLGFALSIDDFCTGYSSIAMLQTLPADVMKIDRAMLLAAETSARSLAILRQMIELGHSLGMKVVVEGIETRKQELLLLSIGGKIGQGFLFAKPMPHEDFRHFLDAQT